MLTSGIFAILILSGRIVVRSLLSPHVLGGPRRVGCAPIRSATWSSSSSKSLHLREPGGSGGGAVEVGECLGPGVLAHAGAGFTGVLVAVLEVDATVLTGQPGLLGGVPEVGPGQGDRLGRHTGVGRGAWLHLGAAGRDGDLQLEVAAAGGTGQCLRCGHAEGGVAGPVLAERRGPL